MRDWILIGAAVKVLLYPAYHSTDFDVHRNWLAITHNLPLSEWYRNEVSQWTLDYPPFFAWFEWALSWLVPSIVVNDGCLDIVPKGVYGWPTIVFQRTSVLLSELVLAAALEEFSNVAKGGTAIAALIWFHPGWLLLDHIHFQYNAAMFGVLIFSLTAALQRRYLRCGAIFATLLCFKHIYLYVAPAYFVFLLRAYIFEGGRIQIKSAVKLGVTVLTPFLVAFGPFLNDIHQVLKRLFPFSRGLTHAYWAPNVWAAYSFIDRVLGVIRGNSSVAATRGLVGQVEFANLWPVTPATTFALSAGLQLIVMAVTLKNPDHMLACVTLCGFASFLFGWHVHEKAIMVVVVPFSLLCLRNRRLWLAFSPLLSASCFSLFPLVYTPAEALLKLVYTAAYLGVALVVMPELAPPAPKRWLFDRTITWYHIGFIPVLTATVLIPWLVPRLEYAGLMLLSVYSALGVVASFVGLLYLYFKDADL